MQHKRILSLLIAFLFFGRFTHLQATESNLVSKDKKVVLSTLALMFLNNKLSNLANTTQSSDTTKNNLQLKRFPFSKRACLDGAFQPLHTLSSSLDERDVLAKDIPTPRPGDNVRLTTGKVAQIKAVAPPTEKVAYFSYTVALNERISIKNLFDEHLAGLQSKLARCERQLALGDVVLVKNDAKIVILDGAEDDLKPLDTKEITLNPESVQKTNPIGKVVYLDGNWVGLMQASVSLSLPLKAKTNKKHKDEKVEDNPFDQQQLGTKRLSRQARWLVPTSHIRCILDREHRYKVYTVGIKDGKKEDLGLRYPLAARSRMGSLIYQTSSSKFMRRMAHFTDSFTHNVLLQGNKTQVLGTEQEFLLSAHADSSLPSPLQALASGNLSLCTLSNIPDTGKAWSKYTYILQPTATAYTAKLSLSVAHHRDEQTHNLLLHKNSALQPLFWCDKETTPCRYGITLKQTSQPLLFSFAKERDRRIFYNALVWLTSPYVLAIEEVNEQPTGQTRLLACADIKQMTLQQLAHHMQTQWLVREGTLHQAIHFLDPHFIFEKHQQQSLSKYYDWSSQQRYKKVYISLYRTSHPDCIVRFGRYPQLDNQGKTANICPEVAKLIDSLQDDEEDLSIGQLHTEGCQGLCTYVDYLSGKNNDYTSEKGKKRFNYAKDHMWQYYHGRPTPCPNQAKCPYHELTIHQAQCHRLLYSHAPRRIRNLQQPSSGASPFKSQEDPRKARESQYQPSLMEVQCWDTTNGYLQQFMHEQIINGYLWRWVGKTVKDDVLPYQQADYQKRLNYRKNDPTMLILSPSCLPTLNTIERLFFKPRHQRMGYPLTLAELAAIYAYTAWDGLCSDFNRSFRQGNYHKWRWMDGLLHKGIAKLSFLEEGNYPLYTGFKNIRLEKTRQSDQRWQDYTSSSCYPGVVARFHGEKGIKITIDPSMRESLHVPCCDVSWISPYPEEFEVLFARGTAGHTSTTTQGEDGWEVKVTEQTDQLQQVSVWYDAYLQQVPNHPLSIMHHLFGKSQVFNFVPVTYHQLIHKLLSGQSIDVHQKLGLEKNQSLLSISAQNGHTVIVKLLLKHDNIEVNLPRNDGICPLFMAATNGHTDIVKLLLRHPKIKVNLQDDDGISPLYVSAQNGHTSVVKLLLKHDDIDVNLQKNDDRSPLWMAAQKGHTDIVKLLLRHPKIKVNLQYKGISPLLMAAQKGHTDIVKLLLRHPKIKVNLQNHDGASPLYIATQNGHPDIVKLLLKDPNIKVNLQDERGTSPLYVSAQNGHTDIVKLLLKDPNIKVNLQYKGVSPLLMAEQNGHTHVVNLLLEHDEININLQDEQGKSPLFRACTFCHVDIVRLLLAQSGIQVNLATKNPKLTPRDIVYFQMKETQDPKVWDKYYILCQLLIEKGGKLLHFANAYPQPPLRPSNQQALNVDMQTLLSWAQNLG